MRKNIKESVGKHKIATSSTCTGASKIVILLIFSEICFRLLHVIRSVFYVETFDGFLFDAQKAFAI